MALQPIDHYFKTAAEKGASDLHFIVGLAPMLRIDGELKVIKSAKPLTRDTCRKLIESMLTEKQNKDFHEQKDLDLSHEIEGVSRYRVNLHWERGNMGMVARVIDSHIPTLDDIGMPPVVHDLLQLPAGLILVTGPTGCGKSTSLAAMIKTSTRSELQTSSHLKILLNTFMHQ